MKKITILLIVVFILSLCIEIKAEAQTITNIKTEWPYNPRCNYNKIWDQDDIMSCENGIWRIRPTKIGIIWFDFHEMNEDKWYVNKNNINLCVKVKGSDEWQDTELNRVQPLVEVISEGSEELRLKCHFVFPNGAKIYMNVTMEKGSPYIKFRVGKEIGSKVIKGFQWHITFGQAEAVSRLSFNKNKYNIFAEKLQTPFSGGRLKVQHVEWYSNLKDQNFYFSGKETQQPDPNNPWMTRVLGLKQHVYWKTKMRPQDKFAFEARDQPWQPGWKVPKATPWIEGLWLVRNSALVDGDELIYGITNVKDYLPEEYWGIVNLNVLNET